MKRFLLPVVACLLLAPALSGAGDYPRDDLQLYGLYEHVAQAEMSPVTKDQVARDWGYAKGIGIEATLEDDYPGLWRPRFDAVTGKLSHEEASFGAVVPSTTTFYRMRAGVDYLVRIPLNDKVAFEPLIGIEGQFLLRQVEAGSNGAADFRRYADYNVGASARVGARFAINELKGVPYEEPSSPRPIRVFHAEIGLSLPVYYADRRQMFNGHDTRNPSPSPAFFAEAGGRIGNYRPAVFYEGIRFGFENEWVGKPQTSIDLIGVRLGYAF
jgi:hypothetical protein